MKKKYIDQVKHRLKVSKRRKREIIHDLEELFLEAEEHGETDVAVIERLGAPEDYVKECQVNLNEELMSAGKKKRKAVCVVLFMMSAFVCMIPCLYTRIESYKVHAIGQASATTNIFLYKESFGMNENMLFVVGILLMIIAVFMIIINANKSRKETN